MNIRRTGGVSGVAYAVIAPPRSGTELLCDALSSTGLAGRPLEHLRPSHQMNLKEFNDDSNQYLKHLMQIAEGKSQVFGTKLISHFLREHLRCSPQLGTTLSHFKFIRLVREDKVDQAISLMVASKLGRWHVRTALEQNLYLSELEVMEIDAADIATVKAKEMTLRRDELFIGGFLNAHSVSPLVISYESLIDNPRKTVDDVLRFLDIQPATQRPLAISLRPTHSYISERVRSLYLGESITRR